jgi:hypothetical protein
MSWLRPWAGWGVSAPATSKNIAKETAGQAQGVDWPYGFGSFWFMHFPKAPVGIQGSVTFTGKYYVVSVPAAAEGVHEVVNGRRGLHIATCYYAVGAAEAGIAPRVYVDSEDICPGYIILWYNRMVSKCSSGGPFYYGIFDPTNNLYSVWIHMVVPFQNRFAVAGYNTNVTAQNMRVQSWLLVEGKTT